MNPLVAPESGAATARRGARTALSVNVNRVALLRNTRPLDIPNVVHIAALALEAGADGVPRELEIAHGILIGDQRLAQMSVGGRRLDLDAGSDAVLAGWLVICLGDPPSAGTT